MTENNLVAAIGGVFIYSKNPSALAEWYKVHLGINFEHSEEYKAYYFSFYYRDEKDPSKKYYTAWSILYSKDRPEVKEKIFCINYRVNDLEKTVEHLKKLNAEVKEIEEYPEGKFAWIYDPEGNYIELWEDTKSNK